MTHSWSNNEDGSNNHEAVSRVNNMLKSLGIVTWFDGERMRGQVRKTMTDGIDNSALIIVFITRTYIEKVNQGDTVDNCCFEFGYGMDQKNSKNMIPVVMEDGCRNPRSWKGIVGGSLASQLYIDMVDHAKPDVFKSKCEELQKEIVNRLEALV